MTVAELIEALKAMPADADIEVYEPPSEEYHASVRDPMLTLESVTGSRGDGRTQWSIVTL